MVSDFLGPGNISLGFSVHGLSLVNLLKRHPIFPKLGDNNFLFILEYLSQPLKSIFGSHGEAIVRKYSQVLGSQVMLQILSPFFLHGHAGRCCSLLL